MPKESVVNDNESLTVRWDAERGEAEVSVDLGNAFIFLEDLVKQNYALHNTSLHFWLEEPEDFDKIIKALKRAKKAQFKDSKPA